MVESGDRRTGSQAAPRLRRMEEGRRLRLRERASDVAGGGRCRWSKSVTRKTFENGEITHLVTVTKALIVCAGCRSEEAASK